MATLELPDQLLTKISQLIDQLNRTLSEPSQEIDFSALGYKWQNKRLIPIQKPKIIHLDDLNGRMKDYHDCIQIIRDASISKDGFKSAILETFTNRGTTFNYIPDHQEKLGQRWSSFLKRNKSEASELNKIILEINTFLKLIGL